jgi:tetratricopeptide (TPR) repeat protein
VKVEIDDELYERITELAEQGNEFFDQEDFSKAFDLFYAAYGLVPEPKDKWAAAEWILASLGDCLFMQAKYEEALTYFRAAQRTAEVETNAFVYLRIGQCLYELNQKNAKTAEVFLDAYMLGGKDMFSQSEGKYWRFVKEYADIED